KLPLLATRDVVIFSNMILPIFIGREASILAVEEAMRADRLIMISAQKDMNTENPTPKDIYEIGAIGMIMRLLKLPDGRLKVLVQGLSRAKIKEFVQKEPYALVRIEKILEPD